MRIGFVGLKDIKDMEKEKEGSMGVTERELDMEMEMAATTPTTAQFHGFQRRIGPIGRQRKERERVNPDGIRKESGYQTTKEAIRKVLERVHRNRSISTKACVGRDQRAIGASHSMHMGIVPFPIASGAITCAQYVRRTTPCTSSMLMRPNGCVTRRIASRKIRKEERKGRPVVDPDRIQTCWISYTLI